MTETAGMSAPGAGRDGRAALVRMVLDPARPRDLDRVAAYATENAVAVEAVLAHLAGRFAAFEVSIDRLLALASHTTPDRQLVLRDALGALRPAYEKALSDAQNLIADDRPGDAHPEG
jgi:hypothetical protein